jgi:hypothetical protein
VTATDIHITIQLPVLGARYMYIHYIITLHMYREYALKITFHSCAAGPSQPA